MVEVDGEQYSNHLVLTSYVDERKKWNLFNYL